jgi:ubiquinone/menaquinone biosynthesis C-methylase UbiE
LTDDRFAAAFDTAAEEYERGRPGYPDAGLDRISHELGLDGESTVLDLAAGTGKLTRQLTGRFGEVIAVEPLAEMRLQLARNVPGVEPLEGSAEVIPVADASVDAVFVAQAFHWFDGRRALAEIKRVLRRSSGGLALLWNTTPWESRETPWFAAVDDLLEERRVDLSSLRRNASGRWREVFDDEHDFRQLAEADFPNPQSVSRAEFVDGLASRSYIAVLDPADRAAVLAGLEELLDRADAPVDGDQVAVPMRTQCLWTRFTEAP